jgi:hypothetical protein
MSAIRCTGTRWHGTTVILRMLLAAPDGGA